MAAKTPVVARDTSGYVDPKLGVYGGVVGSTGTHIADGVHHANRNGLQLSIFYFADIDDTDTWTSGLSGVVACAWQGDRPDTDKVTGTLTTADGGVFTFDAAGANSNGWLWVLHAS